MKKIRINNRVLRLAALISIGVLAILFYTTLWEAVPSASLRYTLLALNGGILLVAALWAFYVQKKLSDFSRHLCAVLDSLIAGRKPESWQPYEDSLTAMIEGRLLRYYEIMSEAKEQSIQDKKTIQELVSDISHQVKTPIANIKMFTGILKQHTLPAKKREEFLTTMESQINKLDFLMQSLIKMSRLETGTFVISMKEAPLHKTIAQALSGVWARAEEKNIQLSVECSPSITARHDPKWTAEAIMNILDNGIKYTPPGGSIDIIVRPWQFYTRIDITDTGIGIPKEDYNRVFQRFYRTGKAASTEGVGLGLYLAQSIASLQKGYITVKSRISQGTTFSVYLLS